MISRDFYKKPKRPPLTRKKKIIIAALILFSVFFIAYGIYTFNKFKPADGQKEEVTVETGDRPIKKGTVIYVNASGGLSLRKERDSKSERLALIPDKTELEAIEELDGWYRVEYQSKTGWISKAYTTTANPNQPADGSLLNYQSPYGYAVKYPAGWKYRDYGTSGGGNLVSTVAFSNQELPATIPIGSDFLAPVTIQVSSRPISEVTTELTAIPGVVAEGLTVGGVAATKYSYMSQLTNTQVSTIVFAANGKTFILNDGGGYSDDLLKIAQTLTLG